MSTGGTEDPEGEPDEIAIRIEEIGDQFLDRRRKGEQVEIEPLVEAHPELQPHLENRLRLLEGVFRVTRTDRSESLPEVSEPLADEATTGESQDGNTIARFIGDWTQRIRCPHCGNVVQLVGGARG